MGTKNNNDLFFTCSLIEFIGRKTKRIRSEVTNFLSQESVEHIYDYADILHCEPIEKVANEFIGICGITEGDFDNVSECQYTVSDYWDIGELYHSWIDAHISDYNTDFYYQPRDYIAACYQEGEIL